MDLEIRQENKDDYHIIDKLIRAAFKKDKEAKLVAALRKRKDYIPELSLVAIDSDSGIIVGHVLLTRIKIKNDRNVISESLAMAPISVLPGYQKRGVGAQLSFEGFDKAHELGFHSVIFMGHADHYPRLGLKPGIKWNLEPPYGGKAELCMGIELEKDSLKDISEIIEYPKEFNNL